MNRDYNKLISDVYALLEDSYKTEQKNLDERIRKVETARKELALERHDEHCSLEKMALAHLSAVTTSIHAALYTETEGELQLVEYLGDQTFQEELSLFMSNERREQSPFCWNNIEYRVYIEKFSVNSAEHTLVVINDSPLNITTHIKQFVSSYCSLLSGTRINYYDGNFDNDSLRHWFNDYTDDLYIFYFHFKNYYKIFSHFGAERIDKISLYILERLKSKYPDAARFHQYSLERFILVFKGETKDLKTIFTYDSIPIPYTLNKIMIKGSNKFEKLKGFIARN